mgnify:CR=1 FL=1|jgi:CDP-diacylglycerol--glycerol-3-phosphate 3-phosphatidyltransferase|tara:strand:- start:30 stop:584 length:555 start_codon:yes stop_codon:yes gene_type:complete
MTYNIPNIITYFRIALIPCLVMIFYLPEIYLEAQQKNIWATAIFILAAISDWLDGYLARKLDQTSKFGAFIDPVADKLIVIAALLLLVELGRVHSMIALVIIGREFAISALREWMATIGKPGGIAVAYIGKLKTGFQMAAIICLLYFENIGLLPIAFIGDVLIHLAAILTIVSMVFYLRAAMKV